VKIDCAPVRFECCDENNELVFIVDAFDDVCATVEIKTVVTVDSWEIISAEIASCLESMKLKKQD